MQRFITFSTFFLCLSLHAVACKERAPIESYYDAALTGNETPKDADTASEVGGSGPAVTTTSILGTSAAIPAAGSEPANTSPTLPAGGMGQAVGSGETGIGRFKTLALMQGACAKAELNPDGIYYVTEEKSFFECVDKKIQPLALPSQTRLPLALIGSWSMSSVEGSGPTRRCAQDSLAIGTKGTKGYAVTRRVVYQTQVMGVQDLTCAGILKSPGKLLVLDQQKEFLVDTVVGSADALVFTGLNISARLYTKFSIEGVLLTIGKVFNPESWKPASDASPADLAAEAIKLQLKRSN